MAEQKKSSGPAKPEGSNVDPEVKRQMEQGRREAVKLGRAMKELEAFPAFKLYKQVLQSKITSMQQVFMRPLEDDRKSLAQEYLKGGINSLLWAHDLPSVTVAAASELAMGAMTEDQEDAAMPDTKAEIPSETPKVPTSPAPATNGKGN